jgi:alpha-D-xyloside xylohydrolase
MKRLFFLLITIFTLAGSYSQETISIEEIAPGVLKLSVGVPDQFTPYSFCDQQPMYKAMELLPECNLPEYLKNIKIELTNRGCKVDVPLTDAEQLYGFGLQINSFNQRGLKRRPIVNDNPLNNLGYTHAPVPMYLSTAGYAILVNTSRYSDFYCGTLSKQQHAAQAQNVQNNKTVFSTEELYAGQTPANGSVVVDIPQAKGIELFIFLGPEMKHALQRYNLFSGGGAMPALWGLGIKYRVKGDSRDTDVYTTAEYFRKNNIPCDVIGLEPRWQTAAYSCSYKWNNETFPQPQEFIDSMKKLNLKINLWEHAFTHPSSPIYENLAPYSGDYKVWNGLVPDFTLAEACSVFGSYHENTFVKQGISGFKLDECDNSNLAEGHATWSFPEVSRFPSGIDGEQMHQNFGLLYAKVINEIYRKNNLRTYLDYRASGAFASSLPASLYSDTYDHTEYIRMITNSGFSGLLWSPELRESHSDTELMRRIQTSVLSAQTLVNSWYLQHPPWLQWDKAKNNNNEFLSNAGELEAMVRTQFNFRMSLIPYLYSAFARYKQEGIPPFRALIVDYPEDKNVTDIYDEYMIGDAILAAPLTGESDTRNVYLPQGTWYNFNTNEKYEGGKTYQVRTALDQIPIFVKEGTLLPLAAPVQSVAPSTVFSLNCRVYGKHPATTTLFEDDGESYNFEKGDFTSLVLSWNGKKGSVKRHGSYNKVRYKVQNWEHIN